MGPRLLALLCLVPCLGGCSTAIPLPSLVSMDDVTGSIGKPVSPLSNDLDAEDWRRARAALARALEPAGKATAVDWENPKSGARGSIVATGEAYVKDERTCRPFAADVGGAAPLTSVVGTGCLDKSGEWTVSDVKPWKKA